jgi:hypothetical protein
MLLTAAAAFFLTYNAIDFGSRGPGAVYKSIDTPLLFLVGLGEFLLFVTLTLPPTRYAFGLWFAADAFFALSALTALLRIIQGLTRSGPWDSTEDRELVRDYRRTQVIDAHMAFANVIAAVAYALYIFITAHPRPLPGAAIFLLIMLIAHYQQWRVRERLRPQFEAYVRRQLPHLHGQFGGSLRKATRPRQQLDEPAP